jgi:Family of unknown function (DUF6445)
MQLTLHPQIQIQRLSIGREQAPLLVIDNFVAQPDELVQLAAQKHYGPHVRFYPGIRAHAPLSYQDLLATELHSLVIECFGLPERPIRFSMCHFSLVTTPPDKLAAIQRIPHIDSTESDGLAAVHYLFKKNLGGTAFYRHRKTGYEYIDESRKLTYFRSLEAENDGPNMPEAEYINGDTPLFEQIGKQEGTFNRILIYRRNSLHSGCIGKDFVPDANPLTGRLSINSFFGV